MTRLLVAAYFIEAGLLLLVSPWTSWWRRNFFADRWPWIDELMRTNAAHVGVAVMGGLTVLAGLVELYALWLGRARQGSARAEPPRLP